MTMTMPDSDEARTEFGLAAPESAEAVLANAQALLPLVASEADAVEREARLTDTLARAMRAAGVFEMGFPASRGGLEMTLAQQVEVVALFAAVDASAAWNVGVLNAGGMYAGRLDPGPYAELYPTRDMPTSGSFHPRGRAERVDGGFRVTGRWDWGSGSYTAEHVVGGCMVFDGDEPVIAANGKQMHLGLWLPKDAIVPADNWQTLGLRGSGSTSYSIDEPAFVPAAHSFDREAAYDAAADPLNKTPKICHFALGGVVLGVARHAVRLAGEALRAKVTAGGLAAVDPSLRQALGEAMGEVDFAFGGMRTVAKATDDILFGSGTFGPLHEARMTAANAVAAAALRRVLPLCTELAGARYILDVNPMQKVLRDGYGALAHAGTGRVHLGAQAAVALADAELGFSLVDDPLDQVDRFGVAAGLP